MHPSHFYTTSSQGWEKCLVKVSFKSTHFASFGRALKKNVLKLHIFVRLRNATENSSHALSPLQKKIECTCFIFAVSIDIRICNLAWTVVQTGRSYTTPHCSNASVEWPTPALRAPPHQPQADIAVWSGRPTRQTHPHWTFSFGLC